jgi:hypothetical protein
MLNPKADSTISSVSISSLKDWARWVQHHAETASEVCTGLIEALEEIERYRLDAREGVKPLDWGRFLRQLEAKQPDLAKRLAGVKLDRFSLGRLAIRVDGDTDYNVLSFKKDWLAEYLQDAFGATFKIKIRRLTD